MNTETITMTFDKDKKTYKTEAPWGNREDVQGDYIAAISNAKTQLIFYKNDGRKPSKKLLDDIRGYEEILKSNDPASNALKFIKTKHEHVKKGKATANLSNFEIVKLMKNNGVWK